MSPQVSAGTAARRTDATGGGNGAVVPAVAHSPGASFTITVPVARIGTVTQHAGEVLVDLVMTGDQLARAGLGTGAGIARLPRDPAPADNDDDDDPLPVWQEMPEGWEPIDVPDLEKCPIGTEGHTWRMTIEEGCLSFSPVEKCTGSCEWWEGHDIGDIDLGVVRLTSVAECDNPGGWHGLERCDHGVWLVPAQVTPGSWPDRIDGTPSCVAELDEAYR